MPWPTGLVVKNGSKIRACSLAVHADAGVAHAELHVRAQRDADAVVALGVGLVEHGDRGRDGDPAAARPSRRGR